MTCHYKEKEKDMCIISCAATAKSKRKDNVVILSTMWPMDACSEDDNKLKPHIFKFYEFNKGGTDIFDQMKAFLLHVLNQIIGQW